MIEAYIFTTTIIPHYTFRTYLGSKYKKSFVKSYEILPQKLRDKVKSVLQIFIYNPIDKKLHNHGLEGKYIGKRSIDVTGDIRIILKELSGGKYEFVEIYNVGTHAQLYK